MKGQMSTKKKWRDHWRRLSEVLRMFSNLMVAINWYDAEKAVIHGEIDR